MEVKTLPIGYCLLVVLDAPTGLVLPRESLFGRIVQTSSITDNGTNQGFDVDDYAIVDARDSFRFQMNGLLYCLTYTSRILAVVSP